MADKSISELVAATAVGSADLFVLEQTGTAKKLTGQILENWLVSFADGHGGIQDIVYTPPVSPSLVGTLTITLADETEYTVDVTNGNGIASITWTTSGTSGDGQNHNATITYTDGTTSTFTIKDGYKGDTGAQTYVWIRYASQQPTSDSDIGTTPDKWIGIYTGTASTAPSTYNSYTWYQYKGATGDTGVSIVSITKTSTSGLVDTYTVLMSNNTSTTFTVTNGSSIASIEKTATIGLSDLYTVTLTSGETTFFSVTNGKGISSLEMISGTHAAGTSDVYRITYNDNTTFDFSVYNGANGTGAVSTVAGIGVSGSSGDVPLILWGNGAPTTSTIGLDKQLYFDLTAQDMYICLGETSGSYSWSTVMNIDTVLSSTSGNAVANSTVYGAVGDMSSLTTSATTLAGAVNEVKAGAVSNVVYTAGTLTKTINGTDSTVFTAETTASNSSTNLITSGAVYKNKPINCAVNASAGSTATLNDSRITATMRVLECQFGTPSNVGSIVSWTTSAGSITFTGAFLGSTAINFLLAECNG